MLIFLFLGIYFNINLLFVILTVISSIIVLNLHHRAPSKRRVPKWIRTYIIGHVGPYLGFLNEAKGFDRNKIIIENLHLNINKKNLVKKLDAKQMGNIDWNMEFLMKKIQDTFNPSEIKNGRLKILILNEITKCQQSILKANKKYDSRKILNSIYIENEVKLVKIYKEWKILSVIIDRICFFIYLLCFVTSSFWFFHGALS